MSQIKISKVDKDSFDDLILLIRKLATYEKMKPPDDKAFSRLRKDYFENNPLYEAYIAEIEGKPSGYIIIETIYSTFTAYPTIYLEDFFVLQDKRRKGIGQALFNFTIKLARERKCGRIEWTALKWNKIAQNFYKKNGIRPLKEWYFYRMHKKQIDTFNLKRKVSEHISKSN